MHPESVPQPPTPPKKRRRRPVISAASGVLSFVGVAAIAVAIVWSIGVQRIEAPGPLTADKVVIIPQHSDTGTVVDDLVDQGVVESKALMMAALWVEHRSIKFGEYQFKQGASVQDVIDVLASGRQILHSITIPEGLTSQQVVDRLSADDLLVGTVKTTPREGSLMPETYKFARNFNRDQLIQNMETAQQKVVAEVWAHRSPDLPIHSPYEMVTLASIVEKETGKADERPRVAGVFINRLTRGMPLQSDPTVVYGLVGGKGTLGRSITRADLTQKTPYNTYTVNGLPPGPIANPGRAALEAVANPSRTKELYFVADGTGGHVFAENLEQHNQNVLRWRQLEKDAKDKLDPDAATVAPPAAPAAPRPQRANQQRGDLGDDNLFGALAPAAAAKASTPASTALRNLAIAAFPMGSLTGSPLPAVTASPTIDPLQVDIAGVDTGDPVDQAPQPGSDRGAHPTTMDTFPVPAARLADERAQARTLGLQDPTRQTAPASMSASADPGVPSSPPVSNERFGKGKIFDASEGTSLDPLRDKTYDLNSAKTVPVLKGFPGSTSKSSALSYN